MASEPLSPDLASGPDVPVRKPARRIGARTVAAALLALTAVAGIVAFAAYQTQFAPLRTTVLIVDGKRIDMGYFLKRTRMSGQPPLAVLQALSFEEIVKQVAPLPPYNIAVSNHDVEQFLREESRADGSLSDAEFAEWYRQQLNDSQLSDVEFRDLTRARLLIRGLQTHLAEETPTTADQVRLHVIMFPSPAAAEEASARLAAGADFRRLADDVNGDPELRGKGGELGWRSRAGLAQQLASLAFDELAIGEASAPVALDANTFAVVMVSEKAAGRQLEPAELQAAKSRAFDDWVSAEFRTRAIEYHGFDNGYDSDTDAWVQAQIRRMSAMAGDTP